MRLKASKIVQSAENRLEMVFCDQIPKQNLLSEKNSFLIKVVQRRPKSFKNRSETTSTVKQHKLLKLVENVQNY